jgi:hypothetical protein
MAPAFSASSAILSVMAPPSDLLYAAPALDLTFVPSEMPVAVAMVDDKTEELTEEKTEAVTAAPATAVAPQKATVAAPKRQRKQDRN